MNQKKIGVMITYISMGIKILISFFYTPFMLSHIGDSEYGIYSLSLSLVSFITLLDLGFSQTLVRYISKAKALNDKDQEAKLNGLFLKLYIFIAIIAMIIGIMMICLYPEVCKTSMSKYETRLFRIVFSFLLLDTVIAFPFCVFSATINAYEKYIFQKSIDLIMLILKYIAMTIFIINGYKVIAITLITVIASIIIKILNLVFCKRNIKIQFKSDKYDKTMINEIFWFSFYIFLNLIIDFLYNNTDKLILGALKGTAAVTLYSFGIYFLTYFQELSTALSGVFMPKVVYLYEHDKDQKALSDLFLRVGRLQMLILVLALSGFVVYGKQFICLWIGSEYIKAYYVGLIIMLPSIVPLTQNIGISILRAMNLHKYRSYMYLVIALVNVGISIPLGKFYSVVGVAIGTCFSCIVGQIIFMNWYYHKKIKIDIAEYWKSMAAFLAIVVPEIIIAKILIYYFPISCWNNLILHVIGFCAVYSVLFWFCISNNSEKKLIKGIIDNVYRWKR